MQLESVKVEIKQESLNEVKIETEFLIDTRGSTQDLPNSMTFGAQ